MSSPQVPTQKGWGQQVHTLHCRSPAMPVAGLRCGVAEMTGVLLQPHTSNTFSRSIAQRLLGWSNEVSVALGKFFPAHAVWVLHGFMISFNVHKPRKYNSAELGAFRCGTMDYVCSRKSNSPCWARSWFRFNKSIFILGCVLSFHVCCTARRDSGINCVLFGLDQLLILLLESTI